MKNFIHRVGTTYIPVSDPEQSSKWYQEVLGAVENFRNTDKAILDFANQSFFLIRAKFGERAVFFDHYENEHFLMTFEVNGLEKLINFHSLLKGKGVQVGNIEDRGHVGNNFVFFDIDGNKFDVWSELSPIFKEKYEIM